MNKLWRTPTYISWEAMRSRCYREGNASFSYYGGRGIKVCERWDNYHNFLTDMGERPPGHSIDRIDSDKDYTPDNCKWSTIKEQNNNKTINNLIEYDGRIQTMMQWCEELGLAWTTVWSRQNRGDTGDRLFRPPGKNGRKAA